MFQYASAQRALSLSRARAFLTPTMKVKPVSVLSVKFLTTSYGFKYQINGSMSPETRCVGPMNQFLKSYRRLYSTNTAPPPPPPPPQDKNAKGKFLLNRISRFFTFSLSSALVAGALGVSLLVIYLILSELFLPSGETKTFNKAVKLIEQHEASQKALGFSTGERLKAYGEVGLDKWVRNRPVQSVRSKGQDGKDHMLMKFHVESDSGHHGSVTLDQVDTSFWSSDFAYIALDVAGQKRIYIVEPKFEQRGLSRGFNASGNTGFLGLKWGPKKDD